MTDIQIALRARDPLTHDAHRRLLLKWSLQNPGITSSELAAMLAEKTGWELTDRMVRYDLEKIRKELAGTEMDELRELKALEIERLNVLEQEVWGAWRNSTDNTIEETTKQVSNMMALMTARGDFQLEEGAAMDEMTVAEISRKVITGAGDFQFLRIILDIQKQRHKLLGLGSTKIDIQKRGYEVKAYVKWSPDNWHSEEDILEGTAIKRVVKDEIEEAIYEEMGDD